MGIPPGFPTLPSLLRDAGYRTALIGKWHLGYLPNYGPLKSGYDEFFGIMGGFTGYYTHNGDGGEHDLYEGETAGRAGRLCHRPAERAGRRLRGSRRRGAAGPIFSACTTPRRTGRGRPPRSRRRRGEREVDRAEITEGGSPRIYGEMMQILDAGIGRVVEAVRRFRQATRW